MAIVIAAMRRSNQKIEKAIKAGTVQMVHAVRVVGEKTELAGEQALRAVGQSAAVAADIAVNHTIITRTQ